MTKSEVSVKGGIGVGRLRRSVPTYLKGLVRQSEERSNAENLSEVVEGASPRVLQRFLTESDWSDAAVIDELQEYTAERLSHPEGIWVVDESGIVKQGKKSAGVGHQYWGSVGKVANSQMGIYLAYVSPKGKLLVDKQLYLPHAWIDDPKRCDEAGIPPEERRYRSKNERALELLKQAKERGKLSSDWVTGDNGFGDSPTFRDGLTTLGFSYVLQVPGDTRVWEPVIPTSGDTDPQKNESSPEAPRLWKEVHERAEALPSSAWTLGSSEGAS